MTSKRRLLKRSRLCVIVDSDILSPARIVKVARCALAGGADMLQLRSKHLAFDRSLRLARALQAMADKAGAMFIINDRIDVAVAAGCDGLHIGRGDVSIGSARSLLGSSVIIGASAANIKEAKQAKREGADYIGLGPVFRTPIKAHKRPLGAALVRVVGKLKVPVFGIGGIDIGNIHKLKELGIKRIAVIRAVCNSRDPYKNTKLLKEALK